MTNFRRSAPFVPRNDETPEEIRASTGSNPPPGFPGETMMSKEAECRDDAEALWFSFRPIESISILVEPKLASRFGWLRRRQFFRDYAWTCGNIGRRICGSSEIWRRSGVKYGRRKENLQHCVWVSPNCFCGVRPILIGFHDYRLGFTVFFKICFVPKRRAGKVAGKLLESFALWEGETTGKFRRVPDKTGILITPFGFLSVY